MKLFIPLLTFLLCSLTFGHDVDLSKWQLVEGGENLKVYSHKKEKGHKLSIQLKEAKFKRWDKVPAEEIYKKTISKKKKMLNLLGIKNWQVKEKSWRPSEDVSILEIRGDYINSRKQKVDFVEIHEFTRGEKRQYLFTKILSP